jgi:hypothetical protein
MSCKPFKTSEANAKSFLRTKGVIDEFLNVKDLKQFRKLHTELKGQAKSKYFANDPQWNEKLFFEDGNKIVPNKLVFKQIDNINGVKYSKFDKGSIDPNNVEDILKTLSDKFSIPYETVNDNSLPYSGKFEDGRVYINLAKVTPETAWHEFAHPFIEQVKEDNSKLYKSLSNEIQTSTYGKQVLAEVKELYPELDEKGQIEEAIVETIARLVTGKIDLKTITENKTLFQKALEFINNIRKFLASLISKEYNKIHDFKLEEKSINYTDINIAALDKDFRLKHFAQMMQYGHRINLLEYSPLKYENRPQSEEYINMHYEHITFLGRVENVLHVFKTMPSLHKLTNKGRANFLEKLLLLHNVFTDKKHSEFRQLYPQLFQEKDIASINTIINIFFNEEEKNTLVKTRTRRDDSSDDKLIQEKVLVFDELIKNIDADLFINNSAQNYLSVITKFKTNETKVFQQLKNQWKVSDFGGVHHHIGAYMNNAGAKTLSDAIQLFIDLMSKNIPMELATYSSKSKSVPHGAIKLSFKGDSPIMESYLQDIGSALIDYKGKKKRYTNQGQYAIRLTLDDELRYSYDELFINATQHNIDKIELLDNYDYYNEGNNNLTLSNEDFEKLKELSDLTGAPIVEGSKVVYQPTTVKPYKGASVKYSKFGNEVKPGVQELFDTNSELSSIGTAEQYSQYLDTIFPNSKVKDIVYHFGGKPLSEFRKTNRGKGIYFTTDINGKYVFYPNNVTNKSEESRTTAIVNIKDVKYGESSKLFKTSTDKENFYYNKNQLSKLQNNINELRNNNAPKSEINEAIELINDFEPKPVNYQSINIFNNLANDDIDVDGLLIQNPLGDIYTDEKFIIVFEPEQIHILGSNQDVEGFKKFVTPLPTKVSPEEFDNLYKSLTYYFFTGDAANSLDKLMNKVDGILKNISNARLTIDKLSSKEDLSDQEQEALIDAIETIQNDTEYEADEKGLTEIKKLLDLINNYSDNKDVNENLFKLLMSNTPDNVEIVKAMVSEETQLTEEQEIEEQIQELIQKGIIKTKCD